MRARWQDLFGAKFDVLLYDLTSTYFESDPPDNDADILVGLEACLDALAGLYRGENRGKRLIRI